MAIVTMQKTPVDQLDIVYIMYICTNILNKICAKRTLYFPDVCLQIRLNYGII